MIIDRSRPASRDDIRRIDSIAINDYGVPGIALMENAGAGAARTALARFGNVAQALIVCGKGNNGGDGFVVARHLAYEGIDVRIALLCEPQEVRGDAGVNLNIVKNMDLAMTVATHEDAVEEVLSRAAQGTLLVDAILGTGLTGEVRGLSRHAIDLINAGPSPVFAIDIPSGLDADTGRPLSAAIRSVATATFGLPKLGFESPGSHEYTGEVTVIDIGWPPGAVKAVVSGQK